LKRILELQQEEIRLTKALQKVGEAERRIWKDSGVRDLMEQALAYWEDEPISNIPYNSYFIRLLILLPIVGDIVILSDTNAS
jgi:hypothetical protein